MKNVIVVADSWIIFFQLLFILFVAESSSAAVVLNESFSSCPDSPAAWTVENHSGGCAWVFDSDGENRTGSEKCFAFADSHASCEALPVDTSLVVPPLDCLSLRGTKLFFQYDGYTESVDTCTIKTDSVSTDGGTTWETQDWQPSDKIELLGPQRAVVDISATADGQTDVRIRFRYTSSVPWWWQIDEVKVASDSTWLLFLPAIIGRPVL
ncbi:MAG: hypothetical protein D3917_03580 [Candidatus Electrothrix sp. AX5]|nr:hypothetical protein [Candidatus Electrothrix sp. AX5]